MSSPRNNHRYSAQGRRSPSNSPQRGGGNYRSRSRDNRKGSYSRSPRRGEVKDSFTQIYVARLDRATGEEDLQRAFAKFGKIKELALKHTFAFIDYEDHDSAIRAIRDMNRTRFVNGETLLVEQSVPGGKKRPRGPQNDDKCYNCNKRGHWANECKGRRSRSRGRRSRSRSIGRDRKRYSSRSRSRGRDYKRSRSRSYSRGRRRDTSLEKKIRNGLCFVCNERGHIKINCPIRRGAASRRSPVRSRSPPPRRSSKSRSRTPPRRSPVKRSPRRSYTPVKSSNQRRGRSISRSKSRSRSRSRSRSGSNQKKNRQRSYSGNSNHKSQNSNENTREDDRGQQGGERKAERSKRNHKSKSSSAGRRSHTPEAKCGSEMKTAEEELHVGDIATGGLVGVDCDKNKMSTNDNDNSWND